jgi:hypothetical protein
MYQTQNGYTLGKSDVAFVRELKQDGAPVRKIKVVEVEGPVLTVDTYSVQDSSWMNAPVYCDVRRLELVQKCEADLPEKASEEVLGKKKASK